MIDSNTIENLIGDTPVSVQLDVALSRLADKDHLHENYVTRDEFNVLKSQIDMLLDLVGDKSVADQISAAINNMTT